MGIALYLSSPVLVTVHIRQPLEYHLQFFILWFFFLVTGKGEGMALSVPFGTQIFFSPPLAIAFTHLRHSHTVIGWSKEYIIWDRTGAACVGVDKSLLCCQISPRFCTEFHTNIYLSTPTPTHLLYQRQLWVIFRAFCNVREASKASN